MAMGLLACTGSSSSGGRVQEDLIHYLNVELPIIVPIESEVIEIYESVSGENYMDDETMYYVVEDEVIPASLQLIDMAEDIRPNTKEVRRVHEIYISAINEQHAGFTMILQALTTQDGNEVAKANEKLTLARKQMRDYLEEINELADRNNVEIGQ